MRSALPEHNRKHDETATFLSSGSRADMEILQFIAPFSYHPTKNNFLNFNPNHVPFKGGKKGVIVSDYLAVSSFSFQHS